LQKLSPLHESELLAAEIGEPALSRAHLPSVDLVNEFVCDLGHTFAMSVPPAGPQMVKELCAVERVALGGPKTSSWVG